MAWPTWMIRASIKKVLRPVEKELEGEPIVSGAVTSAAATPTLALLSSCGLHLKSDPPFDLGNPGDPTFRQFGADVERQELMISHGHYDESGIAADWQLAFPVDVVRESVANGSVTALHPTLHSFRGYFLDSRSFVDVHLPKVIAELQEGGVGAALLTPC